MARKSRIDYVAVLIVGVPLAALYVLVRAGAFKPNGEKGKPDATPSTTAPTGAVDPAGYSGTQSGNGRPPGDASTPSAGLGQNPPPVPPSSDGSTATTFGAPPPPHYAPTFALYDQVWQREAHEAQALI